MYILSRPRFDFSISRRKVSGEPRASSTAAAMRSILWPARRWTDAELTVEREVGQQDVHPGLPEEPERAWLGVRAHDADYPLLGDSARPGDPGRLPLRRVGGEMRVEPRAGRRDEVRGN